MNPKIKIALQIEALIIFGLLVAYDMDNGGLVGTGIKMLYQYAVA